MTKKNLEELIEEIRWENNRHRNNNHTLKKLDKFLPWFLFAGGLIDIVAGIHFFLTDPAGGRWIKCIFFGGIAIIFGIWWYVRVNKLSTKLVITSICTAYSKADKQKR